MFGGRVKVSLPFEYIQLHRLVPVLEQEVQLAEDLGQVRPVDLVDDEDEGEVALFGCFGNEAPERTRLQLEADRAVIRGPGPVTLEEVLIGIGGMELNQPHLLQSDQVRRQFPGNECLPGARRAIEDDLLALIEQVPHMGEPTAIDQ